MSIELEHFRNYVLLKIILKKKQERLLQDLEKFSPAQKHLSATSLIENLIWEIINNIRARNKDIKRKP